MVVALHTVEDIMTASEVGLVTALQRIRVEGGWLYSGTGVTYGLDNRPNGSSAALQFVPDEPAPFESTLR